MKKIFSFLLVIISICSLLLYGCSSNEQNSRQSEKLSIVTSIFRITILQEILSAIKQM